MHWTIFQRVESSSTSIRLSGISIPNFVCMYYVYMYVCWPESVLHVAGFTTNIKTIKEWINAHTKPFIPHTFGGMGRLSFIVVWFSNKCCCERFLHASPSTAQPCRKPISNTPKDGQKAHVGPLVVLSAHHYYYDTARERTKVGETFLWRNRKKLKKVSDDQPGIHLLYLVMLDVQHARRDKVRQDITGK